MSENPYWLARDIRGIGFKTADAVAMTLGIEKTAMIRVRAGISYALTEARDCIICYGCRLTAALEICRLSASRSRWRGGGLSGWRMRNRRSDVSGLCAVDPAALALEKGPGLDCQSLVHDVAN
jgi:hypothetical protein